MRASVVIPSYNHSAFIVEAIDSVLGSGVELIIIDDGSSDDTLQRLQPYEQHENVQVHAQENHGAHHAINRGLSLATGEVVFILNSDDAFEPDRTRVLLEHFRSDPELVMLCSYLKVVDADGGLIGIKQGFRNMPPWEQPRGGPSLQDTGDATLALLQTNFVATTSNVAIRRSALERGAVELQALRYTHDWDLILTMARMGRFQMIERPLVRYRVHSANTIQEGKNQSFSQGLMRFEIMWTVVRHIPGVVRLALERGLEQADLEQRIARSLPRFGQERLLAQLRAIRGTGEQPPPEFEALLDEHHPLRVGAIELLSSQNSA